MKAREGEGARLGGGHNVRIELGYRYIETRRDDAEKWGRRGHGLDDEETSRPSSSSINKAKPSGWTSDA